MPPKTLGGPLGTRPIDRGGATPGGNLTGIYPFGGALEPKRLELLCEMTPGVSVIDLLVNPEGAITAASTSDLEAAAHPLGRQIRIHKATNDAEINAVFATLSQLHSGALQIMGDSFFGTRSQRLAELTTRYHPAREKLGRVPQRAPRHAAHARSPVVGWSRKRRASLPPRST